MKKVIWFFGSLFITHLGSAQPLQSHLWEHRVVILLAPMEQEPAFRQQYDLWTAQAGEVTERDLVLYRLFPGSGIGPEGNGLRPGQFNNLINRYGPIPEDGLKFILIGKDGTVKMEQHGTVAMQELFVRIDGMPMRRAEMRKQKN